MHLFNRLCPQILFIIIIDLTFSSHAVKIKYSTVGLCQQVNISKHNVCLCKNVKDFSKITFKINRLL